MLLLFPQPRLKCLIHIVKKLSAEHEEFIAALIPEVSGCGGCGFWGFLVWIPREGRERRVVGNSGSARSLHC